MNSGVSASHVLKLYRDLLRYGQQLKLTDQKYFLKRVQREFRQNKSVSNEQADFLYKKGLRVLDNKRVM